MNILHTETLKRWGGQQNRVLMEAVGLKGRGHKTVIACNAGSMLAGRAREAGIKVYDLTMKKQAHLKTIPRLMRIIRDENMDLVSTHSSVDSWAGSIAAKLTGRGLVRFRHNLYGIGRDPLTKIIYAMPDRIIAVSRTVEDVLLDCGIRKERISVVNDSVDPLQFDPGQDDLREELNIAADRLIIGNTSTFDDVKGQEYLLQAFNSIRRKIPCILLFAGRLVEPFRTQYLSHVDHDLRQDVIFLGHRDDIPRVLQTINVFVYPSWMEGLGTALLEAMMMARAVAVSDIPTFDFIQHGINGCRFRARDHADLARKVIDLLEDGKLRADLGARARETARERFSLETMLARTETIYREVLDAV